MEEKKNNNTLTTVVITILVMLVLGLGGFIGYDKLINKTDNESNTTTESKECDCPEVVEEEKGKCPLTKFDNSFTLTDADKEEIKNAISSYHNVVNGEINKDLIKLGPVSSNGYHINVILDSNAEIGGTQIFFYVSQVNGKYKIIGGGGSGDIKEEYNRMIDTLDAICS